MSEQVRVRFAPSPTGYIHVGSLRTALFNYLFARHNNGKFILRIEDTDQSRYVDGAVENLIKSLNILGIEYDEGPDKKGDYGPYFQSQRLDIYKKHAMELIEKDMAYYAFETPEELEEMKRLAHLEGRVTAYDRRARNLTHEEIQKYLNENKPYVIRLKVPLGEEIKFNDLVKGTIKINTDHIDDQVLLKSDGFPTYHLANVVDDHLMGITHIIRGEEWITSVPKHVILYNAFNWEVPEMAHVPLLLNPDKTKLSKRQGDVAVEDYLRKGYLVEALNNFMALLGWNPGEGETSEIFSMNELIEKFSLSHVQVHGAVFNIEKLNWMNNEYIKSYDLDKLLDLSIPFFERDGFDTTDKSFLKKVLSTIRVYLNKLDEIGDQARLFFQNEIKIESADSVSLLQNENTKIVFEQIIIKLQGLKDINPDDFKQVMKDVSNETGIKGKDLFKPLRIALTGSESGPELPMLVNVYGSEKTIKFLRDALKV
ncbi:glutamate--tRNA ligase [Ignavibacteria bacterium CHB1]|nr:MAG: glutamate--tRNA ligase [Chlorobiota bacterium]MBV6398673.1 Glutamate--tRNA ligase [Ignavibacteria bacterium]MCC6885159.1 glutamate--tRNA ligase [Ignavibacteriales bacterium]MCE7952051.1 glutamate--tRNA ligase [Chlorobi bacterium CHB7]MDL1886391.1 glutamate--tRNA ligase [Ignavibacteria bacterium CHB1]RIK48836.1 MAG: glutamate--tRNA ligase [Ignavibacteriota bacterium]